MTREEVAKLDPGSKVIPRIGPRRGEVASVLKREMDAGAYNGWITVRFVDGSTAMYVGEEIDRMEAR